LFHKLSEKVQKSGFSDFFRSLKSLKYSFRGRSALAFELLIAPLNKLNFESLKLQDLKKEKK
jgi:hypothetical protein